MRIASSVLILFLVNIISYAQEAPAKSLRIMFYNAENAFDIYDDTATADDDFTYSGVRRWNKKKYDKKINDLYKTIIAAGGWSPPDIVALCEIENRHVLLDLITGTYLVKYQYGIIHQDSPDKRGIDVCLIYRADKLNLINYEYWSPEMNKNEVFDSRKVLNASFVFSHDTFHIIVNHWPSRKGGVLAAEDLRLRVASMVRNKIDSLLLINGGSKIILTGDFNSSPEDNAISILTGGNLINLSSAENASGEGTYKYSGVWETIDQVLVSEKLMSSGKGLYAESNSVTVFKPDFLLMKDPVYPGMTPFSTYRGFRYQGGVSDHLPVLLDLYLRKPE